MPETVLVVNDQQGIRRILQDQFERAGFSVLVARDSSEGWTHVLESAPDLVITDLFSEQPSDRSFAERVLRRAGVKVLVVSSHGSVKEAVAAIKAGAVDFLSLRDHSLEEVVSLAKRAIEKQLAPNPHSILEGILVGETTPMRRLRERVLSLASLRAPVLVAGESGTGRSTVIRAIHALGTSSALELRSIDCRSDVDALPPEAKGHAILLRGIEFLSPTSQARWADALTAEPFAEARSPARVFASSEQPLHVLQRGALHSGLWRRLMVHAVELPALRDISADIDSIADAIIMRLRRELQRPVELEPRARRRVREYEWVGNVAQLHDTLARASVLSRGCRISLATVEEALGQQSVSIPKLKREHDIRQRQTLIETLRHCGGNKSETARRMKIHRNSVYRLISKHGIAL